MGKETSDRRGFVYFVQRMDTCEVKVGFSAILTHRLWRIADDEGAEIRVLGVIPGTYELEQELHKHFAGARVRGREWYFPSQEIMEYVEAHTNQPDDPYGEERGRKAAGEDSDTGSRCVSLADMLWHLPPYLLAEIYRQLEEEVACRMDPGVRAMMDAVREQGEHVAGKEAFAKLLKP